MGGDPRRTSVQHGETWSDGLLGGSFCGTGKVGCEAILVSGIIHLVDSQTDAA